MTSRRKQLSGEGSVARPIRLNRHKVVISAPRELVYQKMSSIGSGRLKDNSSESSKVLQRSDDEIIVEFKSRAGPFTITTVEQVTLDPPNRITFQHLEGPLRYAREEFVFKDVDGGTELEHEGEFVWARFPVLGWLVGRFFIKRAFERIIEDHVGRIKVGCEARAERSHVFPSSGSSAK